MSDFKEYSDEQLISQFQVLLDEIKQRELAIDLWREIKDDKFFNELSSFSSFTSIIGDRDWEVEDIDKTDVSRHLIDQMNDFFARHGLDVDNLDNNDQEQV
jgi:hypothetical protein